MTTQLNRLALAFGAAFLAIALAAGYWGVIRRDELTLRGDNPRRVLAERRTGRGAILDRNDNVLAESVGEPGVLERRYDYPDLAPVVGYVSTQFGSAGIEAALDGVLHGDAGLDPFEAYWRTSVLGAAPPGRAVRLSIDLAVQRAADTALADRSGAVVVLDAQSGEILAMASHPTYDASKLEADWPQLVNDAGAPLLNRATLAQYQPGGALWPSVAAGALQSLNLDPQKTFPADGGPIVIDDHSLGCRLTPSGASITLGEALTFGCPGPIATIGRELGAAKLEQLFVDLRLYSAPAIGIPTTAGARGPITETVLAAVGQADLTVTPLQMALIAAAITHGGLLPSPQLVVATQDAQGEWQTQAPGAAPKLVISAPAANTVKQMLADGYLATAVTSKAGQTLAWYAGFAPFDETRYVVVVLLEDGDTAAARGIGRAVLAAAQP